MFGVMRLTFEREGGSIKGEDDFFSVARTMPFVARESVRNLDAWNRYFIYSSNIPLIPRAVTPWLTAFNAYS
jgi:hypothetical protein